MRRIGSLCVGALAAAILAAGASAPAAAQATAAKPPATAADLGRLFFTREQRAELDRRRLANVQEALPTQENLVTVNGVVRRSSGPATVWINGVPQQDMPVERNSARVQLGGEGEPRIAVKVGQTLDRNRGEVKDELGGGTIAVRPAEPRHRQTHALP